jgi:hypothetical protein
MKVALVAVASVLIACGPGSATLGGASPSPSAVRYTPIASPTAAAPTRLPGSVVRLSVNGVEHPVSTEILDPGDGPVTIVLSFPFAVDRVSVLEWGGLPEARTWLDDRTLRLVVPENAPSLSFKIAQTKAASGDAVIDQFGVSVTFPGTRVVSVFTVAELAAAGNRFPQTSSSWRIRSDDGLALSPDAKRVLTYDGFSPSTGQVPTFIELETKKRIGVAQPPASDGWFSFADWMADGRLVMVGRGVWVGDANAGGMRRIADAQAAVGGYPWLALPDPAEKRIALWGYNTDGHIAVIDLGTGMVQRLAGPFRRCAADGFASLAWSADGRLIAGTDCDTEEGPQKARVRIVDAAADRTTRTIEGGAHWITGLPTGNFMLVRDSGEVGGGSRSLGLVMGFDGQERGRYLGHRWQMSPDRRYLLQTQGGPAGGPTYALLDLVAGTSFEFFIPCGGRSDGGCPSPHWMRDGRLAFF